MMKVPDWINHRFPKPEALTGMKTMLRDKHIHTVCEEAKCPNIGDCFNAGTATFLILGDICTRNCSFCGVKKGVPLPPDPEEPKHIAETVSRLGLSHTVITSVTRDDLPDKGASQFVNTVREIRKLNIKPTIELLIPQMESDNLQSIINLAPDVINHNIETVKRLYPVVRPKYGYYESLELLKNVKKPLCLVVSSIRASYPESVFGINTLTKSGFMLGLGETEAEVIELMQDLRENNVDILTIGQYLRPSGSRFAVNDYISPDKFRKYEKIGYGLGFKYVASGPYVRSSYKAEEAFLTAVRQVKRCENESINSYSGE